MCFSKGRFFLFQPFLQPYKRAPLTYLGTDRVMAYMSEALTILAVSKPENTLIILISKVAQKWPYGQGGSNFRPSEKTRVFT